MTHQTSPGLNHKAICSLYVIFLIMIWSMKMRWQAGLAQLKILKVLSSYSMKSLFPIFGNTGREAKDLSNESILFQILSTKWQTKCFMRIKLLSKEVLQCWKKAGWGNGKRDTEVSSHGHPANYLIFSTAVVSYRNQMKKRENEVYFWSLLVTFWRSTL